MRGLHWSWPCSHTPAPVLGWDQQAALALWDPTVKLLRLPKCNITKASWDSCGPQLHAHTSKGDWHYSLDSVCYLGCTYEKHWNDTTNPSFEKMCLCVSSNACAQHWSKVAKVKHNFNVQKPRKITLTLVAVLTALCQHGSWAFAFDCRCLAYWHWL